MLYKFKSKATGDLILLEPQGRRILALIGKDAQAQGIILVDQMPAAMQRLHEAVTQEEARHQAAVAEAQARGEPLPPRPEVSLRQRAAPFIDMLRRAHAEEADIVWGA